jgi:hypothetical protein
VTQPQRRERQAAGDEGAVQTALIMAAVKSLRLAKVPTWSAQRLADEMVKVGVPWNRNIVVNLEGGRRKSLRVHEAIALAYVLDADRPLDVLVPFVTALFPVAPDVEIATGWVRDWFDGETGPLRQWMEADPDARNRGDHERAVRRWRDAIADATMRGLIRVSETELERPGGDDEPR